MHQLNLNPQQIKELQSYAARLRWFASNKRNTAKYNDPLHWINHFALQIIKTLMQAL